MNDTPSGGKIGLAHLSRKAFLYIRQSTLRQIYENTESTKRQYALKEKLKGMGWDESRIVVIDSDLGQSGADSADRLGFQHLMSEVSLGRSGIIAGIEVSRLSRSSSDWGRLLQIAALTDTLIMDEDGVYNVNDFNDRLLLGLKGTLSEAELHYLKARMRGGLLNKAKRGELMRPVAVGYVYNDYGQIAKDPDAQVQEAISVFFNTFKRLGSAHSAVCEYNRQGLMFPSRQFKGFKLGLLSWKKLTHERALQTLENPLYAGIFAYGKSRVQHTVDGRKVKNVSRDSYHAWLPDSHPAYISVAEFEENIKILEQNTRPRKDSGQSGAVREGSALLQGIAVCGICGRKMTLRYSHSKYRSQPIYQCQHELVNSGGNICQRVVGGNIDVAIGGLLLESVNPMAMDAAVAVQREMSERKEEILRLYSQQLERTKYGMELAKRRYLHVDPENRLVAAELEAEWNCKIREHELAQAEYDDKCAEEIRAVDEKLQAALVRLVEDFPAVWNDPRTSRKEKKRIARLLLDDVTITADPTKIVLGVRFKGGAVKVIEIPNTSRDLSITQMELDAVSKIDALMTLGLTNQEIADRLGESGVITETYGKPYCAATVAWLRKKHGLSSRIDRNSLTGWLTAKQKAAEMNVSISTIARLRKKELLEWKTCNINGKAYLYKPEATASM